MKSFNVGKTIYVVVSGETGDTGGIEEQIGTKGVNNEQWKMFY